MRAKKNSSDRVFRGGSFSYYYKFMDVTHRHGVMPKLRSGSVGFRVVIRKKT